MGKFARASVKIYRKITGGKKAVLIFSAEHKEGEITKAMFPKVVEVLKGKVAGGGTYTYDGTWGGDKRIWITPKRGSSADMARAIRRVLRDRFGGKYQVKLM